MSAAKVNTTCLALLTALTARAASATVYYLPSLPARVQLTAHAGSDFCNSAELMERLRMEFSLVDTPDALQYPDLWLRCENHEGNRIHFALLDHQDKTVDEFKMKLVDGRNAYPSLAYLVARRLGTGKKSIAASLRAYLANSRYSNAGGGVQAFDQGDWTTAADKLYRGLESDAPTTAAYFGLYAAHAKLGHAAQARWYMMEYCESEGRRPTRLDPH
jgi:hypothetical protein